MKSEIGQAGSQDCVLLCSGLTHSACHHWYMSFVLATEAHSGSKMQFTSSVMLLGGGHRAVFTHTVRSRCKKLESIRKPRGHPFLQGVVLSMSRGHLCRRSGVCGHKLPGCTVLWMMNARGSNQRMMWVSSFHKACKRRISKR